MLIVEASQGRVRALGHGGQLLLSPFSKAFACESCPEASELSYNARTTLPIPTYRCGGPELALRWRGMAVRAAEELLHGRDNSTEPGGRG